MPDFNLLASPLPARLVLALFLALCVAPPVGAQGGYRQTEFESLGLELPVPRNYDALPVQPNEEYIVAQWTEKPNPREKDKARGRTLPKLQIVWIEKLPVVETPDDAPVGLGGSEGPEVEEEVRIDTLGDFLEHEWGGRWQEGSNEKQKDQGKFKSYSCELEPGGSNRSRTYKGWAYSYRSDDLTIALIGICHVYDWKDSVKIWEKMGTKLEISEPDGADMAKWEKYYARNPEFIDPEYRMEIRSKLVRGWEADDTENYIYVYSTKNQPLISLIKRRIETIRDEYERQFPPTEPVQAVSTVRICKDAQEYLAYGGPRGSGGYWNWTTEELVFFDYEDDDGAGSGTADTKVVLYHEAFHQYIYYSVGQLAPHTWFNEGYGDYFSGAVLTGKKVKSIGPNPWRTEAIQSFIKNGAVASLQELVSMEKAQYYNGRRCSIPRGGRWCTSCGSPRK